MGLRNRTILELLYATGIRRTELTQLDRSDYDPDARTLLVRQGKGGKSRLLPVGGRAAFWLDRYLAESRPLFAWLPSETGLFLSGYGTPLTPAYLGTWIADLLKRAGIHKPGAVHLFRHSMATSMHRNGADIRYVQEMLGHARLETTQIYTHVNIEELASVHARTHPHGTLPLDYEHGYREPELPEPPEPSAPPAPEPPLDDPPDKEFALRILAEFQKGVTSKDKGIECLRLSLIQRTYPGGVVREYYIVANKGKDYDADICKKCPNVQKLSQIIQSNKVIDVGKADFGGTNSELADGMDPNGNVRSAMIDTDSKSSLPTMVDGRRGPPHPREIGSRVWHEIVGHGYGWIHGKDTSHKETPLNRYHPTDSTKDPDPKISEQDPVIAFENEYNDWTSLPLRLPKYFSDDGSNNKGHDCCP